MRKRRNSRGDRFQQAGAGSQVCSHWDSSTDLSEEPPSSGELRGCLGCCNLHLGEERFAGEHESLVAFHEPTKYQKELKLTVVTNKLVGGELQPVEINLPIEGE